MITENDSPPIPGGQVFSTKQAAELTGVPETTLRSWKQRGKFAPVHCVKDGKETLWTAAGIQEIQRLAGATAGDAPIATLTDAGSATAGDAATATVADELLRPLADAIALEVIRQQLPAAVRAAVIRLLTSTDENDQRRVRQLLEGMGIALATSAFNAALNHAIASSQNSLKVLGGSHD